MHSQKLVVLNHFTHVGMKLDDPGEYNKTIPINMKVTTLGKNYEMMCEIRWKHVVEIWGLKIDEKQIM